MKNQINNTPNSGGNNTPRWLPSVHSPRTHNSARGTNTITSSSIAGQPRIATGLITSSLGTTAQSQGGHAFMTSSKSADALEIKDDELEEYQIHDIREEIERLVFFVHA